MVEQMTQRWHGESCRETCCSSLQRWGAEVSKLTEALGFGSPASQNLTGCFLTKQPHSVWQQHGAGQCALIRPTAFIRTSPQLPADAFHLEPHEQEPLCWCFLTVSLILGICPPQVSYLSALVKVYLPAFGFPSAMVSNEKPLGQPQMPASLNQPSSSSLTLPAPYQGLQTSAEPFQLIP